MGLDFSGLRELAYRGCGNEQEREQRDRFVEQGYTPVDASECPFNGRHEWDVGKPALAPEKPSTGLVERLTGIDGKRDYNSIYCAVFDFHKRHNPPKPEEAYWAEVVDDMQTVTRRFNGDPFVQELLAAIYEELERGMKILNA